MTKESGKANTKAKTKEPEVDINRLINIAFDLCFKGSNLKREDIRKAIDEARDEVMPYAEYQLKQRTSASVSMAFTAIGLKELSDEKLTSALVDNAQQIGGWIHQYMKHKISDEELVANLTGPGMQKLTKNILSALHVDEKMGVSNPEEIFNLSYPVLAYTASMAAYKELRKAQDELKEAREQRIRVEAACKETIEMIRCYRAEMERVVSSYLSQHLETFESGFDAMDQAMMEGDVDGYIRGNVEIQKILGYDVQFTNQQEFDDLMDSDFAFKL